MIFTHPDPEIVQPVLRELVDRYRKRHIEIHQSAGVLDDTLTQETDSLRAQLAQTEEDLRKAVNKAGVISLADAKKTEAEQIAHIRDEIQTAQADFAERSALLQAVTRPQTAAVTPDAGTAPPAPAPTAASTAPAAATSGAIASSAVATPAATTPATVAVAPVEAEITPAQIDAYKVVSARVDLLRKTEQDLLTQFTDKNSRVQDVRAQLSEAETGKKKLEQDHPGLLRSASSFS